MIDVKQASRRQTLAAWMTSADNQYFAKSYVNRLWGYLLGVGIIEPLDDIRAGNPPSNPELLDWLTQEFIKSGFDVQHMVKTICKSRTYQLAIATNKWNEDDTINYSHALPRRLPAEVLFDTIYFTTGAQTKIPGSPRAPVQPPYPMWVCACPTDSSAPSAAQPAKVPVNANASTGSSSAPLWHSSLVPPWTTPSVTPTTPSPSS